MRHKPFFFSVLTITFVLPKLNDMNPKIVLIAAGVLQILLCLGSLLVPIALKWNEELAKVSKLIKQIFWTYGGYIFSFNLCFGLISIFAPEELLSKTLLAVLVSFFISAYWLARILIQFFYFDTSLAPKGLIYTLGEIALVGMFVIFTLVYAWIGYLNLV